MNKLTLCFSVLLPFCVASCTSDEVKNVNNVITTAVNAAQFACVEASTLTDAKEMAVACEIVKTVSDMTPDFIAFLDKLIARRELLKKSGYVYDKKALGWSK